MAGFGSRSYTKSESKREIPFLSQEGLMNSTVSRFKLSAIAALLVTPLLIGCAEHRSYAYRSGYGSYGYRTYDPVYRDYHVYDRDEEVYYHRWRGENHRPDRDFRRMQERDRREYWKWRHHERDEQRDREERRERRERWEHH